MKLCCLIVDILFGTPLGVTKRKHNEHQDEDKECEHNLQILYIRNVRLKYVDTVILATVSITFLLTAFTTFWDRFWLTMSEGLCTTDQDIYCYPVSTDKATIVHADTWITNCSEWTTLSDEMKVTFECFQFKYAFSDALAAVGGLITIFTVATKLGAKTLMSFAMWLFDEEHQRNYCFDCCCTCTYDSFKQLRCCRNSCCFECCLHHCMEKYCPRKWRYRVILAISLALTEVALALAVAVIYAVDLFGMNAFNNLGDGKQEVLIIFKNWNKFMLPLGVLSTSLFLEIEYYAKNQVSAPKQCPEDHTVIDLDAVVVTHGKQILKSRQYGTMDPDLELLDSNV